jgi:gamma-glutamyltranspeptidase / glutathione hydrolase
VPFALAPFPPRQAARGMVVAADQLASMAGVATLERGGSAADAAVAAAAVMAVVGPHLCGMGGDMLAMVSVPGEAPRALLAVGRAGSGVDAAELRAEGHAVMPVRGDARSVPVPAAVDGWLALHSAYGRLGLDAVLEPAISLAEEGFCASLLLAFASHLVAGLPGTEELCPDGPLEPGDRVRLPRVARTLRSIAGGGRDAFYGGAFGQALLEVGGGVFREADLTRDLAVWDEPLRLRAWGNDLWTVPPPSQGYLTLAGAWVAEQVGLGADPEDPLWAHLCVEAATVAGFDRPAVLFDGADGHGLLDRPRLTGRAERVRADRTLVDDLGSGDMAPPPGSRSGDGDTTHLCAIDQDGVGVSLTQSNAQDFGSHLVAGAAGVFLHNRGVGFSLVHDHPAELAPGKRPPHTLSPMLVTDADTRLTHLLGAMGGDAQPQILLQLSARMLRAGQDPATALAGARFALAAPSAGPFRLWWGERSVNVEAHAPIGWVSGLVDRGHRVRSISAFDPVAVGCAQIIGTPRPPGHEAWHAVGAADPRSPDGMAAVR